MQFTLYTVILLCCSNLFMSFAWYAHLKNLSTKPIWIAILVSWLVALLEYIFQVPANRIGFFQAQLSLCQLKVLQEIISLSLFIPFALYYMKAEISWNYMVAAGLLVLAAIFIFWGK